MSSFIAAWVGPTLLGSTVLATAATGALIGAGVSAATTLIKGGSILDNAAKGALIGGITGGIAGVAANISSAASAASSTASSAQSIESQLMATGSYTASEAATAAKTLAAQGYTGQTLAATTIQSAMPELTAQQAVTLANNGMTGATIQTAVANGATLADMQQGASYLSSLPSTGSGSLQQMKDAIKGGFSTGNQTLDKLLGPALGIAAYQTLKTPQQNPSQYVVDPVTGKVTSSSVVSPGGTTTTLDPRGNALMDQASAGIKANQATLTAGLPQIKTQQANLYTQAGDPFMNAALNPIKQAGATAEGALTENLGLRGMTGSSFGQQAQTNLGLDYGTALATGTENALKSQIGLQQSLTKDQLNTMLTQFQAGDTTNAATLKAAGLITDAQLAAMKMGTTGAAAGAANVANQNAQLARMISGAGTALGTPNALYPA